MLACAAKWGEGEEAYLGSDSSRPLASGLLHALMYGVMPGSAAVRDARGRDKGLHGRLLTMFADS